MLLGKYLLVCLYLAVVLPFATISFKGRGGMYIHWHERYRKQGEESDDPEIAEAYLKASDRYYRYFARLRLSYVLVILLVIAVAVYIIKS